MAVTTYNELYSLLKENIVYVQYKKTDVILNLKLTLKRELIPESDNSLTNYDTTTLIGEWALSGDSDGALNSVAKQSIEQATMTYPDFLKAFSTNYAEWINIKISDIVSFSVLSEE